MNLKQITNLLSRLAVCLSLCVFSCEKPANTIAIPLPSKPSTGTGTGNSGGSGDGGGTGTGTGTGASTGTDTGTGNGTDAGTLCTDIGQTPIVLAYFTEWTERMPDATLLTHINYAHGRFADPTNGTGGIVITESKQAPLSKVVDLKKVNPRLKVMLMIGGWGMHADGFSEMAKSPAKRTEFCQSVKSLIDQHKLDGVDIDWEYPTKSAEGTGADPNDDVNFNLVLKELRETLGTSKIISFASSSSAKYVKWETAIKYIDYVNVMTYDMGAAPNGHNSPLHKSQKFKDRSWDESAQAHVDKGVPRNRQVMGVPFYGKSEKPPEDENSEAYKQYKARKIFDYSVKYKEIAEVLQKGTYKGNPLARKVFRRWEPTSMVPYLVDETETNVLSYDDPESVEAKGTYVKTNGHLGAMFWEYRGDTDNNVLLKALVKSLYGTETVLKQ